MLSTIGRLRTWDLEHKFALIQTRISLGFGELHSLKDNLGLANAVVEKTAYICRKAQENGIVTGRSISTVLVAAVYAAYREIGIPVTLNDIARKVI